jgi:hypothetical protein
MHLTKVINFLITIFVLFNIIGCKKSSKALTHITIPSDGLTFQLANGKPILKIMGDTNGGKLFVYNNKSNTMVEISTINDSGLIILYDNRGDTIIDVPGFKPKLISALNQYFKKNIFECPYCNGTGKCRTCDGIGKRGGQFAVTNAPPCPICKGTGLCSHCWGRGK